MFGTGGFGFPGLLGIRHADNDSDIPMKIMLRQIIQLPPRVVRSCLVRLFRGPFLLLD